jgi:hypothetical protein
MRTVSMRLSMLTTMICLVVAVHAEAQATAAEAAAPPAQAAAPVGPSRMPFLGLDVFGGGMGVGSAADSSSGADFSSNGFEVGGTLRVLHWLGFTGSFGRTSDDLDRHLQHYLAGPRVTSGYGGLGVRTFAHALAGWASNRSPSPTASSGYELLIGGGFDSFGVMRLQFDYARLPIDGHHRHGLRGFFGGVLAICFRGCRPDGADGMIEKR